MNTYSDMQISQTVRRASRNENPLVALESAVITHGLPYPTNVRLARDLEREVAATGAVPATIAVLNGMVKVGLEEQELEELAQVESPYKVSVRDFGAVLAKKGSGGTTVAGTLAVADKVSIRVFATGGIGGVHRGSRFDISADLPELAKRPVVVVCAGAKAILDIASTLEYLETVGVPVIGYKTDEFPAFYSRRSGLPVSARAESAKEVVEIARSHWFFGLNSAILVAVPPPRETAIPFREIDAKITQAIEEAEAQGIQGQAVTPFLLERVTELSSGSSLKTNLDLLRNNARVAAEIALELKSSRSDR